MSPELQEAIDSLQRNDFEGAKSVINEIIEEEDGEISSSKLMYIVMLQDDQAKLLDFVMENEIKVTGEIVA